MQVTKIKMQINSLSTSYNELKVKNKNLTIANNELNIMNTSLKQKITDIDSNQIHDNYQDIKQIGKNNINQGVVKGDVNIDLS